MLTGEYDYLTTPDDGRRTAEGIPGAEFIAKYRPTLGDQAAGQVYPRRWRTVCHLCYNVRSRRGTPFFQTYFRGSSTRDLFSVIHRRGCYD